MYSVCMTVSSEITVLNIFIINDILTIINDIYVVVKNYISSLILNFLCLLTLIIHNQLINRVKRQWNLTFT